MYNCVPTLPLMEKQMLYYMLSNQINNIQAKTDMKTPIQPSSFKLTQRRIYQRMGHKWGQGSTIYLLFCQKASKTDFLPEGHLVLSEIASTNYNWSSNIMTCAETQRHAQCSCGAIYSTQILGWHKFLHTLPSLYKMAVNHQTNYVYH